MNDLLRDEDSAKVDISPLVEKYEYTTFTSSELLCQGIDPIKEKEKRKSNTFDRADWDATSHHEG
ncbi:hypothetical protein PsorP6_011463 [Peronosclerospora sorghi]|uniref:Uncharacterized protein n=1 Tax=Peronosclerospora sorghi TaxID=230839 RepID=A0ACC0WIY5_9STRA|nr:hypothetical protein PsorP6_011463 [Peronosclerospora sorghi]